MPIIFANGQRGDIGSYGLMSSVGPFGLGFNPADVTAWPAVISQISSQTRNNASGTVGQYSFFSASNGGPTTVSISIKPVAGQVTSA